MRTANRTVVPFRAIIPPDVPRKVSRRFNGGRLRGGLGALGAGVANPIGAGSGTGAVEGASTGASVGSAILPGIGTAVGAIVGAAAGAIAGAFNKTDPENADFNEAVAIWNQNPNAVYSIRNPYLALAGLFDLNITTNIPIYKKFGHMGEQAFTWWLVNTVYQAAQAGQIGPNDTALTIMSKVVQPQINAWGFGAMSDPHSDLITKLIVTLILQYTEGLEGNWVSVDGTLPAQFNSIPPFTLPATVAPAAATQPAGGSSVAAPSGTTLTAGTPGSINTPFGVLSVDSTNTWRLGSGTVGAPGQITAASVTNGQLIANWYNGGQVIWSGTTGWWIPYTAAGSSSAPSGTSLTAGTPGSINTPFGVLSVDNTNTWRLGTGTVGAPGQITAASVINGQLIANWYNGGQVIWSSSAGWWVPYTAAGTVSNPAVVSPSTPATAAATPKPVAPAAPTTVLSTDGSQVTAPGTALETSAGTLIYFGPQTAGDPDNQFGLPLWENGVQNGYGVGLLMLNGGQVYLVNAQPNWYQWTGNTTWKQISGPPTVTTPATTSTVASQQATQACTPATTSGGQTASTNPTTGGVVGTTTTGDPITDADIQSLINQMSAQNATAAQTYDAVMSALESGGASLTTGLSNQVAAQVQASVPSTAAASTGSDTGLLIVGGGLALLGLVWYAGRKRR
jgi:hypothetical protein